METMPREKYDRSKFIGGSDVAAVLGLSKWRSPLDVYLEKTGRTAGQAETPAMRWGKVLEEAVASRFAEETGLAVWKTGKVFSSGILAASIDRAVSASKSIRPITGRKVNLERLLEVKTSRSKDDWGEAGTGEVPLYYQAQVQQYMGIVGATRCDVAVLFGGSEFAIYPVKAEPDTFARLQEEAERWWQSHIVADVPPPPRSAEEVERLFPQSKGIVKVATEDAERAIREYIRLQESAKAIKASMDEYKDAVCQYFGDAEALAMPDGTLLATWKTAKGTVKTNWEELAKELGATEQLIKKHTETKPGSRRFLVKTKEE